MRRVSVLLAVGLLAASCGGGSKAPTTATAAKKALHVVLTAESHHPRLARTWSYQVHVTDAATGKPVACLIHVQVTFGGVPVGQVGRHRVKNGVWKETIPAAGKNAFPPAALGQHVVWQAVAKAPGYRKAVANWPISVVK
ncbi:MAG TPA: hypothetical protein VJ814_01920 [Gaiellaceae bacterium]|nr:hypothetical protein [Gaiellaceae bacterium]